MTLAAFEPRSSPEEVTGKDEEEPSKKTIQELYPVKYPLKRKKMPPRPPYLVNSPGHEEVVRNLGQPPSRVDMRCAWSHNACINKEGDVRLDFRVFMRPNGNDYDDWCQKLGGAFNDGLATPAHRLRSTGVKEPLRLLRCDQEVNDGLDGEGYVAFASVTVEKRPGNENPWAGHLVVRFEKILVNSVNGSIIDWMGDTSCAEKGWKHPMAHISPGS
jgi:hypothetical protein